MNTASPRGSIAILGTGLAGMGHAGGATEQEIIAQASCMAIERSGLRKSDIDGIITSSLTSPWWVMRMAEYMGIRPRFSDSTMFGGSAFIADLKIAQMAIDAGECENVLICYGSTPRSAPSSSRVNQMRAELDPQPYEHPYKAFNPVSSYSLAAARHMYEYGTTRKQLAEVAVAARKWAQLNPDAFSRKTLTVDEVISSRMISDPLTVLDCCLVTDGAGAIVVSSSRRARGLHDKPIYVLGSGYAHWHRQISCMEDLTVTPAVESGRKAFAQAGLTPADVDVVQLYDAFTINPILFLEDLGFCSKGEGGAFIEGGRIEPGGAFPMNTNGGGLSCVHPGMYSIFLIIEAVTQLRAQADARQVPGAEVALVHGNGGVLSSQATAILASSL
ncbi:thiolase [Comamonas thiooxydans]|uniref:Thiolase n=1 Tax=Comamonas thiooxydans TaxID=363952 RepID=A0AA42TUW0_9BURK|nr:thiolase [Comamonas thiooxydans]MDH1334668.1 thiolase [Comamonas thiooxydans]MDH1740887.1 thiolase [Comamonas thiooxydans]MDH1787080.1 thiolase [Comamonas thiooxydans]